LHVNLFFDFINRRFKDVSLPLLTPFYLSVSWVLTISYQLFTDCAVKSLTVYISFISVELATWLNENIDLIVFIYAFTWIFLLSSVIPALLLGKKRSILVQYIVCLALAVLALSIQGILLTYTGFEVTQIFSVSGFFNNPLLAIFYLSIPYVAMIALDMHVKKKSKKADSDKSVDANHEYSV